MNLTRRSKAIGFTGLTVLIWIWAFVELVTLHIGTAFSLGFMSLVPLALSLFHWFRNFIGR
jgi:hypothetical protein